MALSVQDATFIPCQTYYISKKLVNVLPTSLHTLPGEEHTMSENSARPRTGSKAIAIDERAQIAKIRLLLFMSILLSAGLAFVLHILFGR